MSQLQFCTDGRFTIVQFTDLHWRNGDELDQRTGRLLHAVLQAERPDLVVLTGDVIDGSECIEPAWSWRQAVAPIIEHGLPWAAIFGNHDDEGPLSRQQLMRVQQECPGCLSQPGPAELAGSGNYVLTIASSGSDEPAASLYFLDSGGHTADGEYTWITPEQIQWFLDFSERRRLERLSPSASEIWRPQPALVFFHIPIQEFDEVWQRGTCSGSKQEAVCSPRYNSGLFSALRSRSEVLGVFVGHDHLNDFDGTLHGIRLCYGRTSGYGGYGSDEFRRGARVIRLWEGQMSFETWLRLEDGSVIAR
jgi:hypothetical protein